MLKTTEEAQKEMQVADAIEISVAASEEVKRTALKAIPWKKDLFTSAPVDISEILSRHWGASWLSVGRVV